MSLNCILFRSSSSALSRDVNSCISSSNVALFPVLRYSILMISLNIAAPCQRRCGTQHCTVVFVACRVSGGATYP